MPPLAWLSTAAALALFVWAMWPTRRRIIVRAAALGFAGGFWIASMLLTVPIASGPVSLEGAIAVGCGFGLIVFGIAMLRLKGLRRETLRDWARAKERYPEMCEMPRWLKNWFDID